MTTPHGWEKIIKVEAQTWPDELGHVEFGLVWIVTKNNDVFERTIKVGEDIEAVARYYRDRGYTDSNATYFGKA